MTNRTSEPESLDTIIANRTRARHMAEYAPELLEALAGLVNDVSRLKRLDPKNVNDYTILHTLQEARAVIARATGVY